MSDTTEPKTCAKCQEAPAGPGGILCPPCKTAIENAPLYPSWPERADSSEREVA